MKSGSKLIIEINDDGTLKMNGTGLIGTEAELKKDLEGLAREVGGELVVEKHVHKHHHHDREDDHHHH